MCGWSSCATASASFWNRRSSASDAKLPDRTSFSATRRLSASLVRLVHHPHAASAQQAPDLVTGGPQVVVLDPAQVVVGRGRSPIAVPDRPGRPGLALRIGRRVRPASIGPGRTSAAGIRTGGQRAEYRIDDVGQLGEPLLVRPRVRPLAPAEAVLEFQVEQVAEQRDPARLRGRREVRGQLGVAAGTAVGLESVAGRVDLHERGHRHGWIVERRVRLHQGISRLQMARMSWSLRSMVLVETFIARAISWVDSPSSRRKAMVCSAGSFSFAKNRA